MQSCLLRELTEWSYGFFCSVTARSVSCVVSWTASPSKTWCVESWYFLLCIRFDSTSIQLAALWKARLWLHSSGVELYPNPSLIIFSSSKQLIQPCDLQLAAFLTCQNFNWFVCGCEQCPVLWGRQRSSTQCPLPVLQWTVHLAQQGGLTAFLGMESNTPLL